jgi:SAM-dependent methyltransferase
VAKLAPRAGECWLDVATGTGEAAVRAARLGAEVVGVDLAPAMIEKARRHPEPVRWDVGDARHLPYADGAFDVVASSFGLIFAPEAKRVASECRRVLRPGGRIGLTTWERKPELEALWSKYVDGGPPAAAWDSEESVRALLGGFELEVDRGTWWVEGDTTDELWEWFGRAVPPHRENLRRMPADRIDSLKRDWAELYERYRDGDRIRHPRPYLLVTGAKR